MDPEPKLKSALPRTFVLTYAPNKSAPTEVRRVTAKAMFILGSCFLLIFIALFIGCVIHVYLWYSASSSWVAESMMDRLQDMREGLLDEDGARWIFVIPLALAGTPILFSSPFVKRGSRWACYLGFISVAPGLLVPCLCAALSTCIAILSLFPASDIGSRWLILLIIPAAIATWVALICCDILSALRWIARQPMAEKPKESFI